MKKSILAALAAFTALGPVVATAAEAAPQRHQVTTVRHTGHGRSVVTQRTVTRQPTYRTWHRGERFDRRYARNDRIVSNYRTYRLSAPPRGYQWRQSGNDAVLVAIASGLIGAVVAGAIR